MKLEGLSEAEILKPVGENNICTREASTLNLPSSPTLFLHLN